jgi:DNA-binding response OmpR family regulator
MSGLPRRILLVEDEGAIREVVRLHLELAGFDVTELTDGKRPRDLALRCGST